MIALTWEEIAILIVRYGLPFVERLIANISKGGAPTPEEWAALAALAERTPEGLLAQAAQLAGIPFTDPRYQQILALVSAGVTPPAPTVTPPPAH